VDVPFFDDDEGRAVPRQDGIELGDKLELMVRDKSRSIPARCAIDYTTNLIVEPVAMLHGGHAYRQVGLWIRDIRENTLLERDAQSRTQIITLI
jgi:hypothetical protein